MKQQSVEFIQTNEAIDDSVVSKNSFLFSFGFEGAIFSRDNVGTVNAFVSATQIVNRDNDLKLNPIVVTVDTNDNFAVQQAVCQLLKQNVVTIFGPNKPKAAGQCLFYSTIIIIILNDNDSF